jgi:hypothetical protein
LFLVRNSKTCKLSQQVNQFILERNKKMSKKKSNTDEVMPETSSEVSNEVVSGEMTEATAPKANVFTIDEAEIPQRGRTIMLAYPVTELTPGSNQSFLVPATADTIKSVMTSVRTFAYRHGVKLTLRLVDGGVRVWRKADEAKA